MLDDERPSHEAAWSSLPEVAERVTETISALERLLNQLRDLGEPAGPPATIEAKTSSALQGVHHGTTASVHPTAESTVEATHRLHFVLLGAFRVFHNDQAYRNWRNKRSLSVLSYLAARHPSPVHSEILMESFWADAEPEAARNNLHVAVYGVRRSFEDDGCSRSHVVFDSDCYALDPDIVVTTDVQEFDATAVTSSRLAAHGDLDGSAAAARRAVSLYGGDFIEHDPYAEWALPERRRLHRRLCDLLDELGQQELETGDVGSCIASTLRLVDLEPYHERAHARLMRAYARSGRQHLAIEVYENLVGRLSAELQTVPDPATQLLASRVRQRIAV